MTPRLLIVADDLTGAADCGAVCAASGLETVVALGDRIRAREVTAEVVVFDTDTRHLSPAAAAASTRAAIGELGARDVRVLYQKIDSTLRGNFAVEIAAAREAWGGAGAPALAIVAPASPATGRTMHGGRVYLRGVPLEESEVWRNEAMRGVANLPTMLREAAGLRVELIALEIVRAGIEPLIAALAKHAGDGTNAVVCDAETDDDLQMLAAAAARLQTSVLLVGSAGFARHVPAAFGFTKATVPTRTRASPLPLPDTAVSRVPLLFVVGSRSSISREQLRLLAEEPGVQTFELSPAVLLGGAEAEAWRESARQIDAAWRSGADVAVAIGLGTQIDLRESGPLSRALGEFLKSMLARAGGIFCTGGDTARALLGAAGAAGIRLAGEVEPGVAFGTVEGGRSRPVVLKPGAFGSPQALVRSRAVLHRLAAAQASAGIMTAASLPVIGITMGDPTGVGPEIIVKSLGHRELHGVCRPLVIGDAARLREAARIVGSPMTVRVIDLPPAAKFEPGIIDCIDLGGLPPNLPWGRLAAAGGDAAYRYIARAVELARAGSIDAICTAPLNKEALHAGGHRFPGHTELLASLTGTPEVSMMLSTPKLKVIHVTTHIGLIDAIARIEPGLVERTIARGQETLVRAGIARPRIGVCAINPHAGENGLFGRGEEAEKIEPAVHACQARGWDVQGPLPADTLFFRAARGDFDLVVAMYHDQGHGPVKVLGIEEGVNITVGLPVIRTSVDHGTAFDIAGTGRADERSLLAALRQAAELAPGRGL